MKKKDLKRKTNDSLEKGSDPETISKLAVFDSLTGIASNVKITSVTEERLADR